MENKYAYFRPLPPVIIEYIFTTETDGFEESFYEAGFIGKTSYLDPYYAALNRDQTQYLELRSWSRRNGESIVELWNHNEELFSFFCRDYLETFECVKSLIEMARNLMQIESLQKPLIEEDHDD